MRTSKQILLALGVSGAFVIVLALVKYFQISEAIAQGKSRKMPPVAVTTALVTEEEWPVTFRAVGSLSPVRGITLAAEESGRVSKVHFESGAKVTAGTVLLELDTAVEEAQLKGALAQLALAQTNAKRQRALRERNVNSQSDLDDAENNLQSASAEAERIKAVILRKRIVAPFDGVTGIRLVNVGETLLLGTPVVSLQSLDSLFVDFSLPQSAVGKVSVGAKVKLLVDAFAKEEFVGELMAIDSLVDPTTRNIKMQAVVQNREDKLRAGMFADVQIVLPDTQHVLSVPASSVSYAPYGDSLYVIEKSKSEAGQEQLTARQQVVQIGRRLGDKIEIVSGVKPGEEVASSGGFMLRPGVEVSINNSVTPGNSANPTPANT